MVKYLAKKKSGIILIIFAIMVSACDVSPNASQARSKLVPCDVPLTDLNAYKYKANSLELQASSSSDKAFRADTGFLSTDDINVRREALVVLKDKLKDWSDNRDLLTSDNRTVRITITYISPDLIEIIFLNQKLSQLPVTKTDYVNELKSRLTYLADHDEIYFLVTITDSNYTPLITDKNVITLNIPMENVSLLDTDNDYALYKHFDPPLGQDIYISKKYQSGYVTFPMSVQKNGKCEPIIDPRSHTTFTIMANGIKLSSSGNMESYDLTWSFRYRALMNFEITPTPLSFIDPTIIPECCHTPPAPPVPSSYTAEPTDAFWMDMARYVWAYVVDP